MTQLESTVHIHTKHAWISNGSRVTAAKLTNREMWHYCATKRNCLSSQRAAQRGEG